MPKKILIVDDEADVVGILKSRLTSWGYEALLAQSGPECLEVLKKEKPDLILLDVMMPGMSGFEVLKNIKSQDTTKDIPVIMVTVASSRAEMERGLKGGAKYYLTKPYDASDLLTRIQEIIGKGEAK